MDITCCPLPNVGKGSCGTKWNQVLGFYKGVKFIAHKFSLPIEKSLKNIGDISPHDNIRDGSPRKLCSNFFVYYDGIIGICLNDAYVCSLQVQDMIVDVGLTRTCSRAHD